MLNKSQWTIIDDIENSIVFHALSVAQLWSTSTKRLRIEFSSIDQESQIISVLEFIQYSYRSFMHSHKLKSPELINIANVQQLYLCKQHDNQSLLWDVLVLTPSTIPILSWSQLQREAAKMQPYIKKANCLNYTKYLPWVLLLAITTILVSLFFLQDEKIFTSSIFIYVSLIMLVLGIYVSSIMMVENITLGESLASLLCCCSCILATHLGEDCYRPLAVSQQMFGCLQLLARAKVGCDAVDEIFPDINLLPEIKQQILEYVLPELESCIATQWLYPKSQHFKKINKRSVTTNLICQSNHYIKLD